MAIQGHLATPVPAVSSLQAIVQLQESESGARAAVASGERLQPGHQHELAVRPRKPVQVDVHRGASLPFEREVRVVLADADIEHVPPLEKPAAEQLTDELVAIVVAGQALPDEARLGLEQQVGRLDPVLAGDAALRPLVVIAVGEARLRAEREFSEKRFST